MRLKSHIIICNKALDNSNKVVKFGSILPDFIPFYRGHRFKEQSKEIELILKLCESRIKYIKQLGIGMLVHMMCDYFCYSHNEKVGLIEHRQYENRLNRYISNSSVEFDGLVYSNYEKEHKDLLKESIEHFHNSYLNKLNQCSKANIQDIMGIDMAFSLLMSRRVASIFR